MFDLFIFNILKIASSVAPDQTPPCAASDLILHCWLVVLGLTALRGSISVYIGPSPRERENEEK